jgi:integrase
MDVADLQRLLTHSEEEFRANGNDLYPLWVFLANTGLRIGEALALRWANVDLDGGWFTVEEDLDRGCKIGEVKTEAGEHELPMTAALQAVLRDWQQRQFEAKDRLQEGCADHDLVFATATGNPNSERNALRSLKRAAKRAGLDAAMAATIAPHDFRRMTVSLFVASGVDIATAAILGHRRASVRLDVYARALRAPKRAAAERLQAALYPSRLRPLRRPSRRENSPT